jgi:hypothetical protein
MNVRKSIVFVSLAALACASASFAEEKEKGRIGFNASFQGRPTVGLQWHVGERLSLRPTAGFESTSSRSESLDNPFGFGSAGLKTEGSVLEVGLAALYTVHKSEAWSTYTGMSYSHLKAEDEGKPSDSDSISPFSSEHSTSVDRVAVFVGARRTLSSRLAVFGEVGLDASWSDSENRTSFPELGPLFVPGSRAEQEASRIGSFTGGVGVIFYFN